MIKELFNKLDAIEVKIAAKKKVIERAEKALRRMEKKSSWVQTLLVPIAKAIVEKEGFHSFQTMGPFGLTCETSLWFWKTKEDFKAYKNNAEDCLKPLLSIQFRPRGRRDENDVYQMRLVVTTHKRIEEYPAGSIGALNGFGKEEIDITDWSLDTLIAFMYDQNKKEEL
jgi:heme-degrading monooxygenase HmoA